MAFRQPIVAPRRLDSLQEPQYNGPTVQVSAQQTALDESREWVLFPPSQAYSTSQTQTTFTARTPQTAGRSRISDFGSIGITARSDENERDLAREDEEELDSLDEGLHAFHDPIMDRYTRLLGRIGTILPTHDGLGTFPPSSLQVQEQLWQFEQYNPRKRTAGAHLLGSSLRRHLDTTADADGARLDRERKQRIENWRIDQSRLLLDEIEKQSRRMRWSQSSGRSDRGASPVGVERGVESLVGDGMHQHVEGMVGGGEQPESGPNETLWEGITRRLCDLLGIDEVLLSIIFGDALPADENPARLASSLPELASSLNRPTDSSHLPEWHGRLLDRLTRELGFLMQHLSEHSGGAFSTHLHPPGPDLSMPSTPPPLSTQEQQPARSLPLHDMDPSSSLSPHFSPTLQTHHPAPAASMSRSETTNAALWGVEEEKEEEEEAEAGTHLRLASIAEERAYWERTPDVKSIFRLLHTRFAAHPEQHLPPPNKNPNNNTPSTLASLRRASIIHQHHPLVSKGAPPSKRPRNLLHHHPPPHRQIFSLRRAAAGRTSSSCASSNLRKTKRGAGGSGSSRNYWDLGGSGGAGGGGGGSATLGMGMGMGFWAEV